MDSLEILKASVPFATITGVIVGAILNSRLGRIDKTRDQLFGYKVKSYLVLAEAIAKIQMDIDKHLKAKDFTDEEKFENIKVIQEEFENIATNQALFMSAKARVEIILLQGAFMKARFLQLNHWCDKEENVQETIEFNDINEALRDVSNSCTKFIKALQVELGIDKINKREIKFSEVIKRSFRQKK